MAARSSKKLYPKGQLDREADRRASKLTAEPYRSEFRRDFARLIHCPAYRRLQGKTQLFPAHESDYFRNRLTHSQEVAQIAKSIAIRLNHQEPFLKPPAMKIDLDLVEFAALAHDIGHPPFGHNGEKTLDQLMLDAGGFEGNAQTLRILHRLEKKETRGFPSADSAVTIFDPATEADLRLGLNLTYRTLASIVKYDRVIPNSEAQRKENNCEKAPVKGIYKIDEDVFSCIKERISHKKGEKFKTVECHIMDIADDIAYSTYDIEDAIKAGFLTPLSMISMTDDFKGGVAESVAKKIGDYYPDAPAAERAFDVGDVNQVLLAVFSTILDPSAEVEKALSSPMSFAEASMLLGGNAQANSSELCENGYYRTAFTSELVGEHVRSVEFQPDEDHPSQSRVRLKLENFKKVETLKRFAFNLLIDSPRLKISERRGDLIIRKIFGEFMDDPGLLPEDWRVVYGGRDDANWHKRVVVDYIAGMTDRYCVEMYARFTSENPISIWKTH